MKTTTVLATISTLALGVSAAVVARAQSIASIDVYGTSGCVSPSLAHYELSTPTFNCVAFPQQNLKSISLEFKNARYNIIAHEHADCSDPGRILGPDCNTSDAGWLAYRIESS